MSQRVKTDVKISEMKGVCLYVSLCISALVPWSIGWERVVKKEVTKVTFFDHPLCKDQAEMNYMFIL